MESIKIKRVLSLIIDIIMSNTIGTLIFSFLNLEKDIYVNKLDLFGMDVVYGYSFQIILFMIYFVCFDILNNGRTPGKLMFYISVVNSVTLTELSLKRKLIRTFYKTIGVILFPISLFFFIKYEGLTLQDKIIKTTTIITK